MICPRCQNQVFGLVKATGLCVNCDSISSVASFNFPLPENRPLSKKNHHKRNQKALHVLRDGELFKQRRNVKPQWGAFSSAQVYQTLYWAEQAAKIIGKGEAVNLAWFGEEKSNA